jgi:hypothetical protein
MIRRIAVRRAIIKIIVQQQFIRPNGSAFLGRNFLVAKPRRKSQ